MIAETRQFVVALFRAAGRAGGYPQRSRMTVSIAIAPKQLVRGDVGIGCNRRIDHPGTDGGLPQ